MLRIVRNDITKMNTDVIVNTANARCIVGSGCDEAIYAAAGYDRLLSYRKEFIGEKEEGEVFSTPSFDLLSKAIIHAVSPKYMGGENAEDEKLRSCYRNSLLLAKENGYKSIAFPLIGTGSYRYPKEEAMRIAADEINGFLLQNEMTVYICVFDEESNALGKRIYPGLEEYISNRYVYERIEKEYRNERSVSFEKSRASLRDIDIFPQIRPSYSMEYRAEPVCQYEEVYPENHDELSKKLDERLLHASDTFSEYLLYLIRRNGLENADVWKNALVDKKVFSKLKNNEGYHPQKLTALCLCIGARLSLDDTRDLLARAGYALSPSDKTDIIFSYFIENKIYDMIELDIQLEEHGLPCIIR